MQLRLAVEEDDDDGVLDGGAHAGARSALGALEYQKVRAVDGPATTATAIAREERQWHRCAQDKRMSRYKAEGD